MQLTLNATDLRHLSRFVSDDPARPVLWSVLIESSGVMCATNGHILLAVTPENGTLCGSRPVCLKLPKAPPVWAQYADVTVADEPGQSETLTITYRNDREKTADAIAYEMAGPFPAWRNVLPRAESVSATHPMPAVNSGYVSRFMTGEREGTSVRFYPQADAERAVLVRMRDPRYVGLIMPVRDLFETSYAYPAGIVL